MAIWESRELIKKFIHLVDYIHSLTVAASAALECCLTGHLIIGASVSCEILSHPQESCQGFTSRGLYHQSARTGPAHHCHCCAIALCAFLGPNYNLVIGFLSNSGHSPCMCLFQIGNFSYQLRLCTTGYLNKLEELWVLAIWTKSWIVHVSYTQ